MWLQRICDTENITGAIGGKQNESNLNYIYQLELHVGAYC